MCHTFVRLIVNEKYEGPHERRHDCESRGPVGRARSHLERARNDFGKFWKSSERVGGTHRTEVMCTYHMFDFEFSLLFILCAPFIL